ncbi:response regulator, partial [Acinetobacter baumannii]
MGRILVIDDEPGVLTAVKRRLSRDGHSVETADNTEKALRMIEREPVYDAIVTDMSMDDSNSGLRVLHTAFAKDLFAEVI